MSVASKWHMRGHEGDRVVLKCGGGYIRMPVSSLLHLNTHLRVPTHTRTHAPPLNGATGTPHKVFIVRVPLFMCAHH